MRFYVYGFGFTTVWLGVCHRRSQWQHPAISPGPFSDNPYMRQSCSCGFYLGLARRFLDIALNLNIPNPFRRQ